MDKLLTLNEVAEMLRKSPAQMRWMRHQDTGPRSARIGGRVLYRERDVMDWVNTQFESPAHNRWPAETPRRTVPKVS